jgi:hypothetical protein
VFVFVIVHDSTPLVFSAVMHVVLSWTVSFWGRIVLKSQCFQTGSRNGLKSMNVLSPC